MWRGCIPIKRIVRNSTTSDLGSDFQRKVRHARKLRQVLAPLFRCYVFLIVDLSRDRWRVVNSTFGVASLSMGGEQPMPVPCGIVELLVMSENSGLVRLDNDLEIGQKVRILSDHSPTPFVALCILTTEDAFFSNSWAQK